MNKIIFWLIVGFILFFIVFLLSNILAPFIISFIFAYLLQPIIDNNCRRFNLSRNFVVISVFSIFLSGLISFMLLIVPIAYQQLSAFVANLPKYKANFTDKNSYLSEQLTKKIALIDPEIPNKIIESIQLLINSAFTIIGSFANHLWDYTLATVNFFAFVAIVPIVLYYFLRDWPKMVRAIESLFPIKGKSKIKELFMSINQLLSAYIRGQLNICLILSFYYVVGLNLIGLDFSLLFGVMSGFLMIIPFFGTMLSLLVVLLSCYFSFGFGSEIVYVLILFIVGHTVEGYILTPKIIGDKIGLHPMWIIFSVFACGSLLGILGIVLAIPIAGIIKVLITNLVSYYKSSNLYKN